MRARCRFCGDPLDTESPGVYQYTRGWVRIRKGGGGNAIRLPERFQMWACHGCIEGLTIGVHENPTLF